MDFNDCAECRWQEYCDAGSKTCDLTSEEYEAFTRKKNQCDTELLSSCLVENELEASANEEITEIIKKYS